MTLSSKELSQLYAEDYYYGKTSGYPETGYAHAHPDWKTYVDFIHSMKGSRIKWLDVGCAFGFLLRNAREKEIAAFGVDISSYALKQVPNLCPSLAQSLATNLPFPAETFDDKPGFQAGCFLSMCSMAASSSLRNPRSISRRTARRFSR